MTRKDIECIIKWFSHIEQLATDGKTANGFQMPADEILATIKVAAKDSREYVEKLYNGSIPNDLEEAADKFANQDCVTFISRKKGFIAGAKWQKEQDAELIEIAYNDGITIGMTKQKGQIMKEAVEGEIVKDISNRLAVTAKNVNLDKFKFGDKVRIVVCKKED